ncbi:MAG: LytTR family DNA-binding domain-containing protein [Myxococcaceae bacterium]|nr:LytTR family DNA-binding domain-containing protein [Myxococcaceae bacterium]
MAPLKALVVDDEAPARRRLIRMLDEVGVEVAGEAEDGEDALRQARALSPDVVFLDIRMPGLDGMTLAQTHLDLPPIVFCTAYDEFAVKAFEVSAVDYLLKPVRAERLASALEKVRAKQHASKEAVAKALSAVAPANGTRLVSSTRGEVRFFDAKALTRLWASDKYTVFLADGEEQLTEESLSTLEQRLAPHGFLRVHRAELVRLDAVKALSTEDGFHEVLLTDGQRAKVSRRSVAAVKQALGL